jgi:CBS-domain-containing membrane protein
MNATAIMDSNPTVLKPGDLIKTAIRYIMENRYRNLPVVDDQGRYLGSFGVHCLLKNVLPKAVTLKRGLENVSFIQETLSDLHRRLIEMEDKPISMCMNTEAETVAPDTPLVETLFVLYHARNSIPVVEPKTGKLVGVISYFDAGEKILAAPV